MKKTITLAEMEKTCRLKALTKLREIMGAVRRWRLSGRWISAARRNCRVGVAPNKIKHERGMKLSALICDKLDESLA